MRSAPLVALAALLLVGCGQAPSAKTVASPSGSASIRSSPSGRTPLLLVVETKPPTATQPGSISLFATDGTSVGQLPLEAGSNVLTVAGSRIFLRAGDGSLEALRRNGQVEKLDSAPNTVTGIGGLVASPDGTRWVWASQTADTTSQSIFVGGDGVPARKLATLAYPTVLESYAWTRKGVILDSLPMDYFGYRPFNTPFSAIGGMREVDPNSGAIQPFTTPSQCIFSDQAPDGSVACFPTQTGFLVPNLHALRIVSAASKTTDLSLALPRFNYVGDAYFSPDGSTLTVAGAIGALHSEGNGPPSGDPQREEFGTDLVQVADGSIARFGPIGVRPAMGRQSWLPDGRLVLWRPNSIGGPPGLYVLDPHSNGQGSEIQMTGTPIGYLTG